MKAVILAGGFGSRLSEETSVRPKPMVEIGGKPILWHIMKIYAAHGIEEFVICLGYKGYLIKEYFANYYLHTCDVSFDLGRGDMQIHRSETEPWNVTLVDTGEDTMTGGRLQRVLPYLDDEDFCFTYGDGVADVDIAALIAFHREQGATATVTAVQPPGRFGALDVDGDARSSVRGEAARRRRLDQRRLLRAHTRASAHYLAGDRRPCGSRSRCARSRARASSRATATTASGRRWTRCATATTSRSCGLPAPRPGGRGRDTRMSAQEQAPIATVDPAFWRERRVLLTGHTGFKGAWLALWLQSLGARVTGFSNGVPTEPSLYELARVGEGMESVHGDVRDHDAVARGARRRGARDRHPHGRPVARAPLLRRTRATRTRRT